MRYAILSDIHANLDALDRVLQDAERNGADRIVCLGDIVGYGPLPAETLQRIRDTASIVLAGNHDDAVSGRIDDRNFIELAGDAIRRHRAQLSREDLAYLRRLPHTSTIEGAILAHGDLTSPESFHYIDSCETAAANFAATDASLVFVGHTHVPLFHLTGQSGRVYALGTEDFVLESGKRYIVNVGSVGYPRESGGKCYSSYVLYDSTEHSVRFRNLPFAVASVLQRGRTFSWTTRIGLLLGVIGIVICGGMGVLGKVFWGRNRGDEPVVCRTLELKGATDGVRANMKLAAGSPEAILTISFTNDCGKALPAIVFTGKSSTRKFKVPADAVSASFSIAPAADGAIPVIKEFSPECVPSVTSSARGVRRQAPSPPVP